LLSFAHTASTVVKTLQDLGGVLSCSSYTLYK